MRQYLPLVGVTALLVITCCVRPLLQWRRHGNLGIALFRSGSRGQDLRDLLLLVLGLLLVGQAVAAVGSPQVGLIAPDGGPAAWALAAAGSLLMAGGMALLAAAQLDLGASWRIGIEKDARPGLVVGGLYRFCRNPIYLGLLVTLAGYTLLLPTLLSLALLGGAWLGIRSQVAAEEDHLRRTYGEDFVAYARRVGRFLPWLGRL